MAEQWCEPVAAAVGHLAVTEHAIELQLVRLARQNFMSGWVKEAPGIGCRASLDCWVRPGR